MVREFKGVLQQVSYRRIKLITVPTDGKPFIHSGNGQYAPTNLGCKVSGIFHFSDEVGNGKHSGLCGHSRRRTYLIQRAHDQIAQSVQASLQD